MYDLIRVKITQSSTSFTLHIDNVVDWAKYLYMSYTPGEQESGVDLKSDILAVVEQSFDLIKANMKSYVKEQASAIDMWMLISVVGESEMALFIMFL